MNVVTSTADTRVQVGQTWQCDEHQAAADAVPEPHDTVDLWPDYPRFAAVVDAVEGDVAQLVVGTSNSHPRAPDLGDRVDIHVDTLREQARWLLKSDAVAAEDPTLVTDGGQPVDSIERFQCDYCGHEQGEMEIYANDGRCELCDRKMEGVDCV